MVVGASGVINVGSLSVLTPTQSDYEKYKNSPDLGYYRLDQNNADVTINGKSYYKRRHFTFRQKCSNR